MRYVNGVLCVLMLLFAAVQYNDPDGWQWMIIYLIPAIWTGLAAWQPGNLTRPPAHYLLLASVAAGVVLLIIFFPTTSHWWHKDVWWETETAREGMGAMINLAVLLTVWWSVKRTRPTCHPDAPKAHRSQASSANQANDADSTTAKISARAASNY